MRARNCASLSAVSSLASSARQPDFMTLWNTSAFQRRANQPSFSTATERSSTGKLVTSFQVDRLATGRRILFEGVDVSQNLRTVALLCLPTGGKVLMAANFTCSLQPGRLVLINRNAMTSHPRRRRKLGKDAMSRIV